MLHANDNWREPLNIRRARFLQKAMRGMCACVRVCVYLRLLPACTAFLRGHYASRSPSTWHEKRSMWAPRVENSLRKHHDPSCMWTPYVGEQPRKVFLCGLCADSSFPHDIMAGINVHFTPSPYFMNGCWFSTVVPPSISSGLRYRV